MGFIFDNSDIDKITETLSAKPVNHGESLQWRLENKEAGQVLVLTISNNVEFSENQTGSLISVQTKFGYFELHECAGYFLFDPDEVIFYMHDENKLSSMSIGRGASCSLYANIDKKLLNADFSTINPALLLSAMQLSIAENFLAVENNG